MKVTGTGIVHCPVFSYIVWRCKRRAKKRQSTAFAICKKLQQRQQSQKLPHKTTKPKVGASTYGHNSGSMPRQA